MDFSSLLNIFPISCLQALCRKKKGLYELLSSAGEYRKSIILSHANPTGFALAGFARKRQNLSDLGRSYLNQICRETIVTIYKGTDYGHPVKA